MNDLEHTKPNKDEPEDRMEQNAKAMLQRTREQWFAHNQLPAAASGGVPPPARRKCTGTASKYLSLLSEIA